MMPGVQVAACMQHDLEKVVTYDHLKKKKAQKDNLGNYGQVSLTLDPGKIMEQVPVEHISGHMKVNESLQPGLAKGRSYLTSLFAFCDKMTESVSEGRALDLTAFNLNKVGAVPFNFSKAFNIFCRDIHTSALGICSLGGETTLWMVGLRGSWSTGHVPSSWGLVRSGVPQVCPATCPV